MVNYSDGGQYSGLTTCPESLNHYTIVQHKKTWPVGLMCRVLGVKRNGFYSLQKRQLARPVDPLRAEKPEHVKALAKESENSYGKRRIKARLIGKGYPVTRGEAKRLMKAAEVRVLHRKKFKVM